MPFDEALADRVRRLVARTGGLVEKRMFGGAAFLIDGNMCVGVHTDELIVRIAPDETEEALKEPGARIFDVTGKLMKGWLLVSGSVLKEKATLDKWVRRGVIYGSSLPKKK